MIGSSSFVDEPSLADMTFKLVHAGAAYDRTLYDVIGVRLFGLGAYQVVAAFIYNVPEAYVKIMPTCKQQTAAMQCKAGEGNFQSLRLPTPCVGIRGSIHISKFALTSLTRHGCTLLLAFCHDLVAGKEGKKHVASFWVGLEMAPVECKLLGWLLSFQ